MRIAFVCAGQMGATKLYSEATAQVIDEEVRKLVDGAYERTRLLVIEKKVRS